MLKIFARIMANFSVLGMRPHPLHPHAVRLWSEQQAIPSGTLWICQAWLSFACKKYVCYQQLDSQFVMRGFKIKLVISRVSHTHRATAVSCTIALISSESCRSGLSNKPVSLKFLACKWNKEPSIIIRVSENVKLTLSGFHAANLYFEKINACELQLRCVVLCFLVLRLSIVSKNHQNKTLGLVVKT